MAILVHRSLLILLLLMTVFNLAGHIIAPSSCCTIQGNSSSSAQEQAGDTDCLACLLQVGLWVPGALITEANSGPETVFSENHPATPDLIFSIYHPPIA